MTAGVRKNILTLCVLSLSALEADRNRFPSNHGANIFPIQEEKLNYTFQNDIAPLLKVHCTPCHYPGGKVYDRLPFTNYKTVKKLGLRLNTRLKEEQQTLVARWVETGARE